MNPPSPLRLVLQLLLLVTSFSPAPAPAQTVFIPSGAEGIAPSFNGNVGIGIANPGERLSIAGDLSLHGGYLALRGADGITAYAVLNTVGNDLNVKVYGSSGWLDALRIDGDSGRLGLNVSNPGQSLHVWGRNGRPDTSGTAVDGVARLGSGVTNLALDFGVSGGAAAVSWLQSRNQMAYSENHNLALNPNGGNVGIGTLEPTHKLAVNGAIRAKEVVVDTGWADYVFAEDYRLAPLAEVEAHIKAKKHLPGLPSAVEIGAGGLSLGDMQARLLAKIEELTLHVIAQEKEIKALQAQMASKPPSL